MEQAQIRDEIARTGAVAPLVASSHHAHFRKVALDPQEPANAAKLRRVPSAPHELFVTVYADAFKALASSETTADVYRNSLSLLTDEHWQAVLIEFAKQFSWLWEYMRGFAADMVDETSVPSFRIPCEQLLDERIARDARRCVGWMARATIELVKDPHVAAETAPAPGHLLDYNSDVAIAPVIRKSLLGRDTAFVILAALTGAELRSQLSAEPLPSAAWVGQLYGLFIDGMRPWFDLVSTAYDVRVPSDLRANIDWGRELETHLAWRRARSESVRKFVDGGCEPRRVLSPEDDRESYG